MTALVGRLQKLHAERERLDAQPTEPTIDYVETDRTFAEAWASSSWRGRREMLEAAGAVVDVAPAKQRGRWDPERVQVQLHG